MRNLIAAACLAATVLACTDDPDTAAADASAADAARGLDAATTDASNEPETREPAPAEAVGHWILTEMWATPIDGPFAGQAILGHGDDRCVWLGWDKALSTLSIAADGTFIGALVTDGYDDWSGALVAAVDPSAAPGSRAMRVDDCHFCYDHDTEIGKLGHVLVVDGHLEVTRMSGLEFDGDGEACALCSGESPLYPEGRESWNAQVLLRYTAVENAPGGRDSQGCTP